MLSSFLKSWDAIITDVNSFFIFKKLNLDEIQDLTFKKRLLGWGSWVYKFKGGQIKNDFMPFLKIVCQIMTKKLKISDVN